MICIPVGLREVLQVTEPRVLLHFQRSSLVLKSDVLTLCHYFYHQFLFFDGILYDLHCNGPFLEILLIPCFHFGRVWVFANQVLHSGFKPTKCQLRPTPNALTFLKEWLGLSA